MSCDAMRKLHWVIKRCWMCINFEVKLFPCYVFGHLSRGERESNGISDYLSSMMGCFPRPWLQPMIKCMGPEDGREESRWTISGGVKDICVSWTLGKIFITTHEGVKVWSIDQHEEIFFIPCNACMPSNFWRWKGLVAF